MLDQAEVIGVVAASLALFASNSNVQFVADDRAVGVALKAAVPADMQLTVCMLPRWVLYTASWWMAISISLRIRAIMTCMPQRVS